MKPVRESIVGACVASLFCALVAGCSDDDGAGSGGGPLGGAGDAGTDAASGGGAGQSSGGAGGAGGAAGGSGGENSCEKFTLDPNGVCTLGGWCQRRPYPYGGWLNDVWGSSDNDVWMVGSAPGTPPRPGVLIHYDGSGWQGRMCPSPAGFESVSGTSSDDVWIVGDDGIWHWDGQEILRVANPANLRLRKVHAVSKSLAFAVGDFGTLLKWDGSAWNAIPSGSTFDLTGVLGFADDDLWVTGEGTRHWDGNTWTEIFGKCTALWASSPDHVLCGTASDGGVGGAYFFRWDGTSVTQVGETSSALIEPVVSAIAGRGPMDAVGIVCWGFGTSCETYPYDGQNFLVVHDSPQTIGGIGGFMYDMWIPGPMVDGKNSVAKAAWASAGTSYWAVGDLGNVGGPIWTRTTGDWTSPVSHHPAPDGAILEVNPRAAIATSASEAWISSGQLFRFDGTDFTAYPLATNESVSAFAKSSTGEVWGVGTGGLIALWDGSTWTLSNVGAAADLHAVSALPNSVWAGGVGTAFHFDGSKWAATPPAPIGMWPYGIWGSSAIDAWVGGSDGVFHFDGTQWTLDPSAGALVSFWGTSSNDVWGTDGTKEVRHWDGVKWSTISANGTADGWGFTMGFSWDGAGKVWSGTDYFDGAGWTQMYIDFPVGGAMNQGAVTVASSGAGRAWLFGAAGYLWERVP